MKSLLKHKRRYLTILLTGFVVVFLFILMFSLGSFADEANWAWAWIWLAIIYLPPLIALFKVKDTRLSKTIYGLELLFILFVLATFLVIWSVIFYLGDTSELIEPFIWSSSLLIPLSFLIVYIVWKNMLQPIKLASENESRFLEPKVFISYNNNDSFTAFKIKEAIEKSKIPVIIDKVNMKAGTDIKEFIQDALKEATAIVSLISSKSLKSAWVAKETIDTLFLETYMEKKKFIACYLDDDFFQNDYTLKAVVRIDAQLKEVQDLIEQYHNQGIDTRDLNNQKTRLRNLRNNLDKIIGRLRDSLCLDVRDDKFEESMKKLIEAIKMDN